jgi:cell division protein FtsN
MRFEIRAGGAILILLGLGGLSFVVFALGLFAGYDMARNTNSESAPIASVYPLPNAPSGADTLSTPATLPAQPASTNSPNMNNPVTANTATTTRISTAANSKLPVPSMDTGTGSVATVPSHAPVPPVVKSAVPAMASNQNTGASRPVANSSDKYASSSIRHKPFNIQIDAVMDHTNAEQMASRLQKLGYPASIVPTNIGGQTWWRVRVGPYSSQDEASAAEQELREKYKDTYSSN